MKAYVMLLSVSLLLMACSHPLEIIGEGDVLSASGDRDCLLEDAQAGAANCAENRVSGDYQETYFAVPRAGWQFHRWGIYCLDAPANECGFNVAGSAVDQFAGFTAPPLQAIFRPTVNTGLNSVFIGHSFFDPYVQGMPFHAAQAGFVDHSQMRFFSGGSSGAPQALWENASKRTMIQGMLDGGDVNLFGMTYHPDYPTIEGYRNWVNYALQQNPDTRIFIALPWLPGPGSYDSAAYAAFWDIFHPAIAHSLIDTLRSEFPGVDFYCIPYGQSASELHSLWGGGNLPDVDALVSGGLDSVFNDTLGHPDDILVELGRLVWLRAIYGVDLLNYNYDPGYITALKPIAQAIMETHDPAYNAP